MTTAQRIVTSHKQETYAQCAKLESEAQELQIRIDAPNCYDRTFHFYDGSSITKTRDGYQAN